MLKKNFYYNVFSDVIILYVCCTHFQKLKKYPALFLFAKFLLIKFYQYCKCNALCTYETGLPGISLMIIFLIKLLFEMLLFFRVFIVLNDSENFRKTWQKHPSLINTVMNMNGLFSRPREPVIRTC